MSHAWLTAFQCSPFECELQVIRSALHSGNIMREFHRIIVQPCCVFSGFELGFSKWKAHDLWLNHQPPVQTNRTTELHLFRCHAVSARNVRITKGDTIHPSLIPFYSFPSNQVFAIEWLCEVWSLSNTEHVNFTPCTQVIVSSAKQCPYHCHKSPYWETQLLCITF